ncbi:MAG: formimidoylglutamate deiminase [Acidimicrobiia bacterium]|nr:formimidoylglutamate deiminase [Acidimicrobiia bacterium]
MNAYYADLALIAGVVRERVSIDVDQGRFASIVHDSDRSPGSMHLRGLTLPAMANAHGHAFHRALRGRVQTGSGSFWTWRELMYSAVERLDPDNYFRLARATFAEMVLAGYGVVGEFHYVHHRPDGGRYDDPNAMGEALLAAAAEAGIRITLLDALYLHGGIGTDGSYRPPEGVQVRFTDGSVEAWAERVEALRSIDLLGPQHGRFGAAVHSVRAVDLPAIGALASQAIDWDAPLHAHVSEQRAENEACIAAHGTTPTGALRAAGALGSRFTAIHATHLADDDIAALGSARATVCFCPTTERDLGDGIGPSRALVDAGVRLSVGSDSHAVIDPFEEARAIELDERLASGERGVHSTASLLEMASANGHRSLGWDDAGMIAIGSRADLVTVSLDSVRTAGSGSGSALESALFSATAADVCDVVVDGVPVVADGRHARIDVAAELAASIGELFGE